MREVKAGKLVFAKEANSRTVATKYHFSTSSREVHSSLNESSPLLNFSLQLIPVISVPEVGILGVGEGIILECHKRVGWQHVDRVGVWLTIGTSGGLW
jgi:hypothetical protein